MAEKKLRASIVIGGLIDGSLKAALTETKAGFQQLGSALKSATKAQRDLRTEFDAYRIKDRDITSISERYAHLTTAIEKAEEATKKLRKAESFKSRMDKNAEGLRSVSGRATVGAAMGGVVLGSTLREASTFLSMQAQVKVMGAKEFDKKEAWEATQTLWQFYAGKL